MNDLEQAIAFHRAGRLAEAEAIYRRILAGQPDHAQVLNLLGLIACQAGRLDAAAELLARATLGDPASAEYHINLGEVQRRRGHMPEALAAFAKAATLAPQNAVAHYNLAVGLAANGQSAEALTAYQRALALQPDYPEAHNNLGLLLCTLGRNEEALACLTKALAARPGHAELENNIGLALWNLDRHAEAVAAFERAARLKPNFAAAHANRGWALRRLGRRQQAVDAFQAAARLNPSSANVQRDLARALLEIQSHDAAIAAARRAVELAPRQADAHHALGVALGAAAAKDRALRDSARAAYRQALALQRVDEWEFELAILEDRTPPTAPDSYVCKLFDDYAPNFENHLVGQLSYRAPHDLHAAMIDAWRKTGAPDCNLDILDLGCGTGLCGELFRPHARTLAGIDLSAEMIAAARQRRDAAGKPYYDRLLHAHIVPALEPFTAAFDLIVAADVLIYVAALEPLFAAAARALRPGPGGGMFAFSLERHDGPEPFILRQRYQHDIAYVRRLAAQCGLAEITMQPCQLRTDVPPGWLVILQNRTRSVSEGL